jgi:hypothetical protein
MDSMKTIDEIREFTNQNPTTWLAGWLKTPDLRKDFLKPVPGLTPFATPTQIIKSSFSALPTARRNTGIWGGIAGKRI